jgi:FkbM family methyltransferase
MFKSFRRKFNYFNEFLNNKDIFSLFNAFLLYLNCRPLGFDRIIKVSRLKYYIRGGTTDFLYVQENWERDTYKNVSGIDYDALIVIGACIGEWFVKLNRQDQIPHCNILIEPNPDSMRSSRINLLLNNINAICLQKAVSTCDGPLYLLIDTLNTGSSYVSEFAGNKQNIAVETITLNAVIDSYCPDCINPLIMIDVEGMELDVIRSGASKLNALNNFNIVLEYSKYNQIEEISALLHDVNINVLDKDNILIQRM